MSQPAENWRLDAFARVAAWHFANPPATWRIARCPSGWGWCVTAPDGTYISSYRSKRDAAANRTDGPDAKAHYATLDWYLGYSCDPRPLTDAEREAVAQVVSSATVETT